MYADAKAISKISYMNNDIENGEKYEMKAIEIKKKFKEVYGTMT